MSNQLPGQSTAYGEFSYALNEALELTLGLRYTEDDKETTLTNTLVESSTSPRNSATLRTVTDEDSWSKFNPALTVSYSPATDINLYDKVSTGYRAGGYNVRASNV